jgi:hypothetical protein
VTPPRPTDLALLAVLLDGALTVWEAERFCAVPSEPRREAPPPRPVPREEPAREPERAG